MRLTLTAIIFFILGANLWAYPTHDGVAFGFAEFGYFHQY